MKRYLFFLPVCCFLAFVSSAQTAKNFSYLIVRMQVKHDPETAKAFYKLEGEANNPNSNIINALVKYSYKEKAKEVAAMYGGKNNGNTIFFNYFNSVSEALQFLDERGWQLFSVVAPEHAETVYYLMKETN